MKIILWTISIISALNIFSLISSAQPPQDVDGWSKVKWGMTEAEVSAAFPGRVIPYRHEKFQGCRTMMEKVEVVGYEMNVNFDFDCASKKLNEVSLFPTNNLYRVGAVGAFEKLAEELIVKYGDPSQRKSYTGFAEYRWIFPSTEIELNLLALGESPALLILTYKQREKEDML